MSNRSPRRIFRVPSFAPFYGSADYLIRLQKPNLLLYYSYDTRVTAGQEGTTYLLAFSQLSLRPIKTMKIRGQYRVLNTIEEKGIIILRDTKDKTSLLFIRCYKGFKISRTSLGDGFYRDLSQILYNQQLAKLIFWHAGEITYLLDPNETSQEPDAIFKTRDGICRIFMDSRHNCLLGFSKSTLKIYSFNHKKVIKKLKTPFAPENILCYKPEDRAIIILEQSEDHVLFQLFTLSDKGFDAVGEKLKIPLLESGYYLTFCGFNGKNANQLVLKLQYRALISLRDTRCEYELLLIDIWNPKDFRRVRSHELRIPEKSILMSYSQILGSLICKTNTVNLQFVSLEHAVSNG